MATVRKQSTNHRHSLIKLGRSFWSPGFGTGGDLIEFRYALFANASNSINRISNGAKSLSGIMFGPSDGAWSGS
jgi:hypothetical protein